MSKIKIEQYVVGSVGTNCYFIVNQETNEVLMIDPGDQAEKLAERIKAASYQPKAILLTHGHFDHVLAVKKLSEQYGIPVYAHEGEKETLTDPRLNLSGMTGKNESYTADVYVTDKQTLTLAGFDIEVLHTPGHTDGGCCYYIAEHKALISGDTLFAGSIGRTDFPNGSAQALISGIKQKLMVLPDDVIVYPGHMEQTTILDERERNPFL